MSHETVGCCGGCVGNDWVILNQVEQIPETNCDDFTYATTASRNGYQGYVVDIPKDCCCHHSFKVGDLVKFNDEDVVNLGNGLVAVPASEIINWITVC